MQDSGQLLRYLQQGIDALLRQEGFDGGQEFRRTQKQALEAYKHYLNNDNYTTAEKLKGFFEIPTGVGKTAVFVGIVAAAHKVAEENGEKLKTAIIVPTAQLLDQTLEAFQGNDKPEDDPEYFVGFAPWMKGDIGFYGDGKKNLKNSLTIMTYDAFVALTEAGELSSENIDILISDEAHRGTSDRRVESITNAFNDENTVQLAFTATAHFDEEKTVLNSHRREIFYKSVADAIREGELAAYVSSQRYIIRVDPDDFMLSDEFQKASDDRKIAYRRAAKQNAWNKRMVKIFREGCDEKTGDLLSDNQAGFFVEGIKQANKLEDLLNSDITLAERARSMGYEGVAVAIHSQLSNKEQKQRYKEYKEGKYLAVIGDEMFKEGFDHSPMKTLFDCPHSSVVDKAQILGRGLRKWWNKFKDRYEGLTIIDTVMYFGDEDSDIQENNRDRALVNTVSVKQVLAGNYIVSDEYFDKFDKQRSSGGLSSGGGLSLFNDDPDVEEYSSLEELYELEEQVSRLRKEHLILITDDMRNLLFSEVKRTGVGSISLCKNSSLSGIDYRRIEGWKRDILYVDSEEWDAVIAGYKDLNTQEDRIFITEGMRVALKNEMSRTGIGAHGIMKNTLDMPNNFQSNLVKNLASGLAKSVMKSHWDWCLKQYQLLPNKDSKVVISDDMRKKLQGHILRTNKSLFVLLSEATALPAGLNSGMAEKWLVSTKTAKKEHWDWVIDKYATLDSVKVKPIVSITALMLDELVKQKARTGVGAKAILKNNSPEGITTSMIETWLSKAVVTAKKEHWDWVLDKYKILPNKSIKITISEDMRLNLLLVMKKTRVKNTKILSIGSPPVGLKGGTIKNWMSGTAKTAEKEHWDWVMGTLVGLQKTVNQQVLKTNRSPS